MTARAAAGASPGSSGTPSHAARIRVAGIAALALVAATLPWWAPGDVRDMLTLGLLYGFLAASWNISGGLGGQISVGHAAFFGLGAYGVGIFYVGLGLSPYLGILAGAAAAALCACLLGAVSFWLPFSGYTFLLLTLSFAELVRAVMRTLSIVGGADGIMFPFHPGIATLQFRDTTPYYLIALALVAGVLVLTHRIRNSGFGLRLESVRDDEGAAIAMGVRAPRVKLAALVISAALTAVGGALYATMFSFVTPDHVFSIDFSVAMITGALIGGCGTVWGPVVGGTLLWSLTELLAKLPLGSGVGAHVSVMLYGIALVLIVQRLPRGVVPSLGLILAGGRGSTRLASAWPRRLRRSRVEARRGAIRPSGGGSPMASAPEEACRRIAQSVPMPPPR